MEKTIETLQEMVTQLLTVVSQLEKKLDHFINSNSKSTTMVVEDHDPPAKVKSTQNLDLTYDPEISRATKFKTKLPKSGIQLDDKPFKEAVMVDWMGKPSMRWLAERGFRIHNLTKLCGDASPLAFLAVERAVKDVYDVWKDTKYFSKFLISNIFTCVYERVKLNMKQYQGVNNGQ
jgi:hypothetical protein